MRWLGSGTEGINGHKCFGWTEFVVYNLAIYYNYQIQLVGNLVQATAWIDSHTSVRLFCGNVGTVTPTGENKNAKDSTTRNVALMVSLSKETDEQGIACKSEAKAAGHRQELWKFQVESSGLGMWKGWVDVLASKHQRLLCTLAEARITLSDHFFFSCFSYVCTVTINFKQLSKAKSNVLNKLSSISATE